MEEIDKIQVAQVKTKINTVHKDRIQITFNNGATVKDGATFPLNTLVNVLRYIPEENPESGAGIVCEIDVDFYTGEETCFIARWDANNWDKFSEEDKVVVTKAGITWEDKTIVINNNHLKLKS